MTLLTPFLLFIGCDGSVDDAPIDWEAAQGEILVSRLERNAEGNPCVREFTPERELPQSSWERTYKEQATWPPETCAPARVAFTDLASGDCWVVAPDCLELLDDPLIGTCEQNDDPECCESPYLGGCPL